MISPVLLLGTDHRYQRGDVDVPQPEIDLFRSFLFDVCRSTGVAAIAEEMSVESLVEHGRTESVAASIAKTLELSHCYCDPTRSEQLSLGIPDENSICAVSMMNNVPRAEIERLISEVRRKREPIWLAKMVEQAFGSVLFICGSWHVPSFSQLLDEQGHSFVLVHDDWTA